MAFWRDGSKLEEHWHKEEVTECFQDWATDYSMLAEEMEKEEDGELNAGYEVTDSLNGVAPGKL